MLILKKRKGEGAYIVNNMVTNLHIFQRSLKLSGSFNHSDMINFIFGVSTCYGKILFVHQFLPAFSVERETW